MNRNGSTHFFTLTCVTTGGPATTVIWTRDSTINVTEGTVTLLNDPIAAHYTHTLTVPGKLGGLYQCTISNSMASASSTLLVQG